MFVRDAEAHFSQCSLSILKVSCCVHGEMMLTLTAVVLHAAASV